MRSVLFNSTNVILYISTLQYCSVFISSYIWLTFDYMLFDLLMISWWVLHVLWRELSNYECLYPTNILLEASDLESHSIAFSYLLRGQPDT